VKGEMAESDRTHPTDLDVLTGGRQLQRRASPRRQASYDDEVRRLIGASQRVMLRKGRTEGPTIAEILGEAGLSKQAFYRHFASRDDVIVATYEAGLRLTNDSLERRVKKHHGLSSQLRAFVDGVLAPVRDPALSELTSTILWNVAQIARNKSSIAPAGRARMLDLVTSVLVAADVTNPTENAVFIQALVKAFTDECLASGHVPSSAEQEQLVLFCLRGLGHGPAQSGTAAEWPR